MLVPDAHLEFLDWPAVLQRLASGAQSDRGRAACKALLPLPEADDARLRAALVAELMAILRHEGRMPSLAFPEIEPYLRLAGQGGALGADELGKLGVFCEVGASVRRFFGRFGTGAHAIDGSGIWALAAELGEWDELGRMARDTFDGAGEIRDSASPELARLRRERDGLSSRVRLKAEELMASDTFDPLLQDRFVTQRGDRFVLPVRASFKSMGLGIVHDTSRTGETVFIEPTQLVELNNRLKVLELEIRHECRRILEEIAMLVAHSASGLRADLTVLAQLDLLLAMARYGVACDATAPVLVQDAVLNLRDLRHPLLVMRAQSEGFAVVANDLHLGGPNNARLLVISGPNAGGKTVLLKSVGLAVLAARAGLPVPAAAQSQIGMFAAVLADIGDHQSVLGDLSTFSAHLANLAGILETVAAAAPSPVLVLCDELMAGTNPEQGSALARACLERLAQGNAVGVCTTHYDALKALGESDQRFRNAGMEYDIEHLRPTFRLRDGQPGRSYALDIAARMGLPALVLQRARDLAGATSVGLEDVLRDLESREATLAAQEEALIGAREQWERQAEKEQRATAALASRERELATKTRETIEEAVKQTREALRDILRTARREANEKGADKAVANAHAELARAAAQATQDLPQPTGLDLAKLKAAWTHRNLKGLSKDAIANFGKAAPTPASPIDDDALGILLRGRRNTIDVRGMRVDEALGLVQDRLDEALLQGADAAFVIHGYGTGALRKAVRELLTMLPSVGRHRPGARDEGGDGVTVAVLRG